MASNDSEKSDANTLDFYQSPEHQRLKFMVDNLADGNMSEMARLIGVRPGVITDIFGKRQNKPSFDLLVKIANAFPQLRLDWVITGEGAVLKSDITDAHPQESSSYRTVQSSHLDDARALRSISRGNARRVPVANLKLRVLPYVPIEARAGIAEFYSDDVSKYSWEEAETLAVIDVPETAEYKEAIVIAINGDSMEPTIKNGSKVVVTPVQRGNWQYLNPGIYCLIFLNNFVVKRVKDNTLLENGLLRLHSDNPTGGHFQIKGDDIRAVWRVRWAAYTPIE